MKKIFIIILIINCFSIVISQNDFSLTDLNPYSDTYDQSIGPSYFSNNIIIIGFFHEYWGTCRARFGLLNDIYLDLLSENITDVKIIGMGKDQYYDSLEGMINERILPWVQDSDSENYPIWSDFGASQRDVFFLNYNGMIDTSFSITPYSSSDPEDVEYLKELILRLRTNQALEIDNLIVPKTYFLHQNFPNPFNPFTKIEWALPKNEFVNITIYNSMGEVIKTLVNSFQPSGYKTIKWDATDSRNKPVSTGLYIYRLQAGSHVQTKKMILLR